MNGEWEWGALEEITSPTRSNSNVASIDPIRLIISQQIYVTS